jgi:hypothetical protein
VSLDENFYEFFLILGTKKEYCSHFVFCYCRDMENIKVSELISKIHAYSSVNPRNKPSTRTTIQAMMLENALRDLQFDFEGDPKFQASLRHTMETVERLTERARIECEGQGPLKAYN